MEPQPARAMPRADQRYWLWAMGWDSADRL